jgi:MEMO1 family protein
MPVLPVAICGRRFRLVRMTPETREPAVAGRFYPGDPGRLDHDLARYLGSAAPDAGEVDALAVMAPHAGYMYSGSIAGETYARVRVPERVVVLCPNHTGLGSRRSVWSTGAWRIPGGDVGVDVELARRVRERAGLEADQLAHLREHAIEVHLPFLRAKNPGLCVVPICLAQLSLADCRKVGEGLAEAIEGHEALLVASTDMSHYVSADAAERLDRRAIERVEALDPEGLYQIVNVLEISMCGYIPTTVTLFACRALGARSAKLVRYGNSGEASGDFSRVVGYAGVVIS